MSEHKIPNALIYESSPYLLQHAYNPVQWHAWNDETLAKAQKQNKLLLLSIGYATCHWCHVMERESFENQEVAQVMNKYFICIKVDREERPDVDQIYMDAVHLLTGSGGWPLHSIALPDGKPFWGGTYFSKENWVNILTEINRIWTSEPQIIVEYAENLTQGIRQKEMPPETKNPIHFDQITLQNVIQQWKTQFDSYWGGMNRTPKFPMPNNYYFLMRFAHQTKDAALATFIEFTLTKMAYGGIFDAINGGFARYSTDEKWHIPHFEKMLYDNAQLVSLYADAYLIYKKPLFKEVVDETLRFVQNELYDGETGGFYSALDADSENALGIKEEGAYYVWKEQELQTILGNDFEIFSQYYNINALGHWEHGNYVLLRMESDEDFILKNQLSKPELTEKKIVWKEKLRKHQSLRPRPLLDDKMLTSWNALICKGFTDAYRVFQKTEYLNIAERNMDFLLNKSKRTDGGLNRNYKNGISKINAYLEDYSTVIEALISLYEATFQEKYLLSAQHFTEYVLQHFADSDSEFFYFTSDEDTELIHRKIDFLDNVIASGNSIMAINLFKLGHLLENSSYIEKSKKMMESVFSGKVNYPTSFSNWLQLSMNFIFDFYEIAVSGTKAQEKNLELMRYYIPNKVTAGSCEESNIPLLQQRFNLEKTNIFVCANQTCFAPENDVYQAIQPILNTGN